MRPIDMHRRRATRGLAGLVLAGAAGSAAPQGTGRALRIVVPFAPGGSADGFARALAAELGTATRTVVVENKPGAAGNLGSAEVGRAEPDGRTLLYTTASIAVNQSLYPNVRGFELFKDLQPVAVVAAMPHLLAVKTDLPVRSVAELVALMRANPGKLNYSSAGQGTSAHLSMELFKRAAGVSAVHIPYRGGAPSIQAIASGEVDCGLLASFQVLPMLRLGRVRALAVSSAQSSQAAPELPTLRAAGVDVVSYQWHGLFAPAKVPQDTIAALHDEVRAWMARPATLERIRADGSDPAFRPLEATRRYVQAEIDQWRTVIRAANIQPE